jgi:hypothetical protein
MIFQFIGILPRQGVEVLTRPRRPGAGESSFAGQKARRESRAWGGAKKTASGKCRKKPNKAFSM